MPRQPWTNHKTIGWNRIDVAIFIISFAVKYLKHKFPIFWLSLSVSDSYNIKLFGIWYTKIVNTSNCHTMNNRTYACNWLILLPSIFFLFRFTYFCLVGHSLCNKSSIAFPFSMLKSIFEKLPDKLAGTILFAGKDLFFSFIYRKRSIYYLHWMTNFLFFVDWRVNVEQNSYIDFLICYRRYWELGLTSSGNDMHVNMLIKKAEAIKAFKLELFSWRSSPMTFHNNGWNRIGEKKTMCSNFERLTMLKLLMDSNDIAYYENLLSAVNFGHGISIKIKIDIYNSCAACHLKVFHFLLSFNYPNPYLGPTHNGQQIMRNHFHWMENRSKWRDLSQSLNSFE